MRLEKRTEPDENTICECDPETDLEVIEIVDIIDTLTGAAIGKKPTLNKEKKQARKEKRLAEIEEQDKERTTSKYLSYIEKTNLFLLRQIETGEAMPQKIKEKRALAWAKISDKLLKSTEE